MARVEKVNVTPRNALTTTIYANDFIQVQSGGISNTTSVHQAFSKSRILATKMLPLSPVLGLADDIALVAFVLLWVIGVFPAMIWEQESILQGLAAYVTLHWLVWLGLDQEIR